MRKALTTTRTARASKPGERATPTRTARATKPGKRATLTPAQKAAATKRRNGLDLSAIARKALATRQRNARAAARQQSGRSKVRPVRKAAAKAA